MDTVRAITVGDAIRKLQEYNPDAALHVVVSIYPVPFEFTFGGGDGCTKDKCESVCLTVEGSVEEANSRAAAYRKEE